MRREGRRRLGGVITVTQEHPIGYERPRTRILSDQVISLKDLKVEDPLFIQPGVSLARKRC